MSTSNVNRHDPPGERGTAAVPALKPRGAQHGAGLGSGGQNPVNGVLLGAGPHPQGKAQRAE